MDHAALRHQMAEVVHAARDVVRDPAEAPRLWGLAASLCEAIERDCDGHAQRVSMAEALSADIRCGARSTRELVDDIVWFVRAMEHDLEDEERDVVADDVVTADQVDG